MVIIVCVSPTEIFGSESLQTLKFGTRVRKIKKGKIEVNRVSNNNNNVASRVSSNTNIGGSVSSVAEVANYNNNDNNNVYDKHGRNRNGVNRASLTSRGGPSKSTASLHR